MNPHHFNRLGNPRPLQKLQRELPDWQHRIIRWASVATNVVSLGIMVTDKNSNHMSPSVPPNWAAKALPLTVTRLVSQEIVPPSPL